METAAGNTQRRVVLARWKHHQGDNIEVYSNLKNFCAAHPEYNYNTLNNYLSKKKIPFEDKQVLVMRKPVLTSADKVPPRLPRRLFWEFDYEKIDWPHHYRMVIERVLEWGAEKEWQELIRYYGEDKIVETLKQEISYLPDHIIDKVTSYFNLKSEQLKCYIKKQCSPKLWI